MKKLNISTEAGPLELTPATPDELKLVAARWPMGMVFSQAETQPNGLVFQVGEQEAYGIKSRGKKLITNTSGSMRFGTEPLDWISDGNYNRRGIV